MKSADDIKKQIEVINIKTNPQAKQSLLDTLHRQMDDAHKADNVGRGYNIWSLITMNKLTKFASVAMVVMALYVGNYIFLGQGSNVAFANIAAPFLNAKTVVMDIMIGPEGKQVRIHDEVIGSLIRRSIPDMEASGHNSTSIIDLDEMTVLDLDHDKKRATFTDLAGLGKIPNYLKSLQDVVFKMEDTTCFTMEDVTVEMIDDVEHLVYVAKNNSQSVTVWANAETLLPVRIEQKTKNMVITCENMVFDSLFDDLSFSMAVPDGYKVQEAGTIDFSKGSEEAFLKSLRIWAEIIEDGYFPDSVNMDNIVKIGPKMEAVFKRDNYSDEAQMKLGNEFAQGIVFIRFFKGKGKWHYDGKGVAFGDSETPIFWYEPRKSKTWRVIYGDLTVEDVAKHDLPVKR